MWQLSSAEELLYATARSTSDSHSQMTTASGTLSNSFVLPSYYVNRLLLKFDTSIIGAGKVTAVKLTLTPTSIANSYNDDVQIVQHNWSGQDPVSAGNREAAYDGALAAATDAIWSNTANLSLNTPTPSAALSPEWVVVNGTTYYAVRMATDKSNTAPTSDLDVDIAAPANGTVAYLPTLNVTYSLPGGRRWWRKD